MSFIHFNPTTVTPRNNGQHRESLRTAYTRWVLDNHGDEFHAKVEEQRTDAKKCREVLDTEVKEPRPPVYNMAGATEGIVLDVELPPPLVGIVGGGFAGMFAGLILQSLGIEFELFESSDRMGGRIYTWYSGDYDQYDKDCDGLYGEVGGMRLPQFSEDMLPVQQLALAVNAVLERNGLDDHKVYWRKFHYDAPEQRLRYNNMEEFTTAKDSGLKSLNFDVMKGGDVPEVWVTTKQDGNQEYLPINKVLDRLNEPFLNAIDRSFSEGFELLMQYDEYSMWDYLTTQFRLGDMGKYYDPAMGKKSDLLPWSIANYLETTNVGSGMYSVSFVEMVIAVYDWNGSKNPYDPNDNNIYMLTVDKGMQCFPDACRMVLDMQVGVTENDGDTAQRQVGMLPQSRDDNTYRYDPPNLKPDAKPPHLMGPLPVEFNYGDKQPDVPDGLPKFWPRGPPPKPPSATPAPTPSAYKKRVNLQHEVIGLLHDEKLFGGQGGMRVAVRNTQNGKKHQRQYPYVVTTLPNCVYLNGEKGLNLLEDISFEKAQAIRECNYMASFKAFLTFKEQFWKTKSGEVIKGGVATTDRPIRQIVYPSYGYAADQGVLQVYCWAEDARKLGAHSEKERIEECLKGIQYLYPEVDVYKHFAGFEATKTWFWDQHSGGGAFALFKPGQFKKLYPTLLTPEFNGHLNFAGECCSVHHGWIVGALDSAYNAVLNILRHAEASGKIESTKEMIEQMQKTWGTYLPPDIKGGPAANKMSYAYKYNLVDRKAASVPPGRDDSIYGDQQDVFDGQVPAFIENYKTVPQSMKSTKRDKQVLAMLNATWDDNVARRAHQQQQEPPRPVNRENSVTMLEGIYYGDNFQTIPAPKFWLKDDDEFARQQLAGFMPNLLEKVSTSDMPNLPEKWTTSNFSQLISKAGISIADAARLGGTDKVKYVADYRRYLKVCTVTPVTPEKYYLAKPLVFFAVNDNNELMPVGIQLDQGGELFTPDMKNAENAWLLAKMQTNCAGQTLHDVGYHQLLTHQIAAMVSIALFSEEVFNPNTDPHSAEPFQQHPVFKLLRPHVVKTVEFQQSIYNQGYHPSAGSFPATRVANGAPGVYNIGSIYDQIFSCGRIGNYQLQDKMYYDEGRFHFLDLAFPIDTEHRDVGDTPFSYAYVHDARLWYDVISRFVNQFIAIQYPDGNQMIAADIQLQRFFTKLIPAFNHGSADRFPSEVNTVEMLHKVLTLFIWQFSVQHTVVNDGAYNHAVFVPNASTLMYPLPEGKLSSEWTPADVLACLPSQTATYKDFGNMTFMDLQINASVIGQGPYPDTVLGRGVLEPSLDFLQDTYNFTNTQLREAVFKHYRDIVEIGEKITERQAKDTANYLRLHPGPAIPETVVFDLITPVNVMNTIQT